MYNFCKEHAMTISTSLIIFSPSRPVPLAPVADGLAFIPPLPTTQFSNALPTGGINSVNLIYRRDECKRLPLISRQRWPSFESYLPRFNFVIRLIIVNDAIIVVGVDSEIRRLLLQIQWQFNFWLYHFSNCFCKNRVFRIGWCRDFLH